MIRPRAFTIFAFLLSAFILVITSICFGGGEILFEEDWESGDIDEDIWVPAPGWKVVDGALDANGGESGYTVQNDFTNFEFSADTQIIANYLGFVMRAQDQGNLFMHQVGAGDANIWWHSKVGGAWALSFNLWGSTNPPYANEFADPNKDERFCPKCLIKGGNTIDE